MRLYISVEMEVAVRCCRAQAVDKSI